MSAIESVRDEAFVSGDLERGERDERTGNRSKVVAGKNVVFCAWRRDDIELEKCGELSSEFFECPSGWSCEEDASVLNRLAFCSHVVS